MRKIFLKILEPIINFVFKMNKFFYFSLKYYLIKTSIKDSGLKNISIFKYNKWHHGFCYFIAFKKGKKVFIKVDTKFRILENEKYFYNNLEDELSPYLVKMHDFHKTKYVDFIVFDFLESSQELNEELLLNNLRYLEEIIFILKTIKSKKIIHRDIKLDNFMIVHNKIKIIDFTFSNSFLCQSSFKELNLSSKKNYFILKGLGLGLNPKDFIWNDFISMQNIINNILSYELTNLQISELKKYKLLCNDLSENATYLKTYNYFKGKNNEK